ncbi:exodeoxyribonuclease VII large subunit [bacterium]|nr:exodeoxyribonuclease VII large subunit [bacterium]
MRDSVATGTRVPVLRVSELNRLLRTCLEADVPEVWVAGEISNLKVHTSGHCYFRLKDADGQIAAVMFRSAARLLRFKPQDGLAVLAHGRVSIYEVRGDLQLYVDAIEPRGVGGAQLALEQLKRRLAEEGLFASERKRPLPYWPRRVGVVTALSGAAVHDIVTTLRGRLPGVRVVLRPVRVQGDLAGADIVAALDDLGREAEVDVIIVGRGGGSIEDLWAFNEERVARAIAAAPVPVVSAVGHEIDVTLADLAADCRAATPTAAAAMVVPEARQLAALLSRRADAMAAALLSSLRRGRERVTALARHVRDPRQTLVRQRLRIDELADRGARGIAGTLRAARARLAAAAERLQALSPLAVLERGYAIAHRGDDGQVVRSAAEIAPGDELDVRFRRGAARVRVERVEQEGGIGTATGRGG